jgi:hypothetical protein
VERAARIDHRLAHSHRTIRRVRDNEP